MNRRVSHAVRMILWTLLLFAAPSVAAAGYAIESYTIEVAETGSSGGGYVLTGTIEPPDPSVKSMTGDGFELTGELHLGDADGLASVASDVEDEARAGSQCGRGVEEALPLLMIGLVGLYAVARPRTRPSAGGRRRPRGE